MDRGVDGYPDGRSRTKTRTEWTCSSCSSVVSASIPAGERPTSRGTGEVIACPKCGALTGPSVTRGGTR